MKRANENLVALNFAPIDDQYRQLVDTFEVLFPLISILHGIFSSKFVNKLPIGKKNSLNTVNYGKISINV